MLRTDSAPPVAIGGVGGSGTRIVAELLHAAGFHIGGDLNPASDNLWFTLLFKRREILDVQDAEFDRLTDILVSAMRGGHPFTPEEQAQVRQLAASDRPQHPAAWLSERAESLLATSGQAPYRGRWGWKEPNTHLLVERLLVRLPTLRYVHVVRHGVDMAFSANQNQLSLWGPHVLGEDGPITPSRSLAYWCRVQQRVERLSKVDGRVYWLDYDRLCAEPANEARKLCRFLDCSPDAMGPVLDQVRPPGQPRHASKSLADFCRADLDYVRSLGYQLEQALP